MTASSSQGEMAVRWYLLESVRVTAAMRILRVCFQSSTDLDQ